MRRRQSTATFRQRLVERKWKIEGLFGEAKQNHSVRRARYRGLPKVQIQFFMIAIALNCKRVVKLSELFQLIYFIFQRSLPRKTNSIAVLDCHLSPTPVLA